jgi:hypothetical protein
MVAGAHRGVDAERLLDHALAALIALATCGLTRRCLLSMHSLWAIDDLRARLFGGQRLAQVRACIATS